MPDAEREQAAMPLEDVDRSIIAELTRDGRMSVTQVAETSTFRGHMLAADYRLTSGPARAS